MMRVADTVTVAFLVVFSMLLLSCSGSDGDGSRAQGESIYDAGAPVPARGFDDSSAIELLVSEGSGRYTPLADGQCLEPGRVRLGVRVEGSAADIDRVFVSDGGSYQVEATFDGGLYACAFDLKADRMTTPILVQVIHKDGRASKAKVVVRTSAEGLADALVLRGAGIMVDDALLDGSKDQVADLLEPVVDAVTSCLEEGSGEGVLSLFSYKSVDVNLVESAYDDTRLQSVLHVNLTVRGVNLRAAKVFGQELVSTSDNDMTVDACVGISDLRADGSRGLVLTLGGPVVVSFSRDFFLRPLVEDLIAQSLARIELASPSADLAHLLDLLEKKMPLTITLGDTVVNVRDLLDRLDLDLTGHVFLDLAGMSDESGMQALAMEAGLYVGSAEGSMPSPAWAGPSVTIDTEAVFMDMFSSVVDAAFDSTRQKYGRLVNDLAYGDANPATRDIEIESFAFVGSTTETSRTVRVRFVIKDVDFRAINLFGFSLISTSNNDLTVDATVMLAHSRSSLQDTLLVDVTSVHDVDFEKPFLGDFVVEEIVKNDIGGLDTVSIDLGAVMDDVVPPDYLHGCLDFGPAFPDVGTLVSPYLFGLGLEGKDTLNAVITQDTINHALVRIFRPGFEWNVYEVLRPLLGEDFSGFQDEPKPGEETILTLSAPPVLDMRANRLRMEIDGVRILYRLDGKPVWEASLDLDLILDARVENGGLAFYLTTAPENCHFHIMKDNRGNLGVFDHSNLVNDVVERLPQLLGKQAGSPLFTVSLDALDSFLELDDTDTPLSVKASGGCLYVSASALAMDITWLKDIYGDR